MAAATTTTTTTTLHHADEIVEQRKWLQRQRLRGLQWPVRWFAGVAWNEDGGHGWLEWVGLRWVWNAVGVDA